MTAPLAVRSAYLSNPFATRFVRPGSMEYRFCIDGVWRTSQSNLREIAERLSDHGAGLIFGPHGSGKTTLLHSLGPWVGERFPDTAQLQLRASACSGMLAALNHARHTAKFVFSQQSQLCDGGLMMIDGAEQLRPTALARLLRRTRRRQQTVLATSHRPLPGMTVLHETSVSSKLVVSLTRTLTAEAGQELVDLVDNQLCNRDLTTLTNVRDLWFDLYDVVQPVIRQSAAGATA